MAAPGTTVQLEIELVDKSEEIVSLSFDLLLESAVLALADATDRCFDDDRLDDHGLSVSIAFDPVVPLGFRRFRFVLFNNSVDLETLGSGPIVHCRLPVRDNPPIRSSPLRLERVLPLDSIGIIRESLSVSEVLVIDPNAPTPTSTSTATATATSTDTPTSTTTNTPTATPTSTPSATPTATSTSTPSLTPTPSPTPTQTRIPCEGDCDGDGSVSIAELVRIVQIGLGQLPADVCRAADRDDNNVVAISELIAAVNRALNGCPSAF